MKRRPVRATKTGKTIEIKKEKKGQAYLESQLPVLVFSQAPNSLAERMP